MVLTLIKKVTVENNDIHIFALTFFYLALRVNYDRYMQNDNVCLSQCCVELLEQLV